MKWSDYYKGLYASASQSSIPNRGRVMARANVLIMASTSYEQGAITEDQFQFLRREAQAAQATDDEAVEQRRNAALAAYLKNWSEQSSRQAAESGYQIVQPAKTTTTDTNCQRLGSQVNCTSTTR